jgi:hypothetical protein
MTTYTSVLKHLIKERDRLNVQLERLTDAVSALKATNTGRTSKTMSAAGRARIAAAQRARWAKIKGQKVVSIRSRRGRTISAAARRRIVAAQKARWAKWRKAHGRS